MGDTGEGAWRKTTALTTDSWWAWKKCVIGSSGFSDPGYTANLGAGKVIPDAASCVCNLT